VKPEALRLRAFLYKRHIVATDRDLLLCLVKVKEDGETSLALRHQNVYDVVAVLVLVETKSDNPIKVKANSLSV